ncbi:MAG: ribosome recycling factor [Clostridiales bacterium]|jgi:ribosome recycling factor|nr:ribosome recycling factor [Clostridiales bacterium]
MILDNCENKLKKTVKNLENEFATIRTGRANPRMLDKIFIEYYDQRVSIKNVSNINIPDSRTILIQPWDNFLITKIQKAISISDLNLNPILDGKVLRITIPPLTEERRKELSKISKKITEEAKISIRNIRRDVLDSLKTMQKQNKITENEMKINENKIQKLIDKYVNICETLLDNKKKDIMTI